MIQKDFLLLGKVIRERRLARKMSQAELAELLGFSNKATVSRIEQGRYHLNWRGVLLVSTYLRDEKLVLMWWQAESAKLARENEELVEPLRVITELLNGLKNKGAFRRLADVHGRRQRKRKTTSRAK